MQKLSLTKHVIPPGSRSKSVLQHPPHLSLLGSNTVISRNEAQNLLLYAGHCARVVASIDQGLHSAGLSLNSEIRRAEPKLTSRRDVLS